MAKQVGKKFTLLIKNFSSLQSKVYYSAPVLIGDCKWYLSVVPNNGGSLCMGLHVADPESLPSGWKRYVKLRLSIVKQTSVEPAVLKETHLCFDRNYFGWEIPSMLPLTKLLNEKEGFLVNGELMIVAEVEVLEVIGTFDGSEESEGPYESVKKTVSITEPLSSIDGNQAAAAAADPSDEGTDVEGTYVDGSFEEDVDSDDASSPLSDDEGGEISPSNQSNALEDASNTVGNHDIKSNSGTAETDQVSIDNAPNEDVNDEASSLVSNDSARDGTSLDQVESLEDASQTMENGGRGFNNVASITETANNLLTEEVQPAMETIDVNGFAVFSSQVELVSHIFKRHPDIALAFRPKNQQIRRAYMNELLNLIEMLCQSPEKLSEDDLSNAYDTLADLIDVGFKLDWLKTKLNEVSEKKKKEQSSRARLQTMEEQLQKLKLMFLDLETQLQMEKALALAARAPLSFHDVVC